MSVDSNYYVQKPKNAYWLVPLPNYVVQATAIDPKDEELSNPSRIEQIANYFQTTQLEDKEIAFSEKIDAFVHNHLKVVNPKDYHPRFINKGDWTQCMGGVRNLTQFESYIQFYHFWVDFDLQLPLGWALKKGRFYRVDRENIIGIKP